MLEGLGQRIKIERIKKNIKASVLANLLDVGVSTISNWENDKAIPPPDKMMKLAEHLETSIDFLYGVKDIRSMSLQGLTEDQIFYLQQIKDTIVEANEIINNKK